LIEWARVSYSKKDGLFTLSLIEGTTEQRKMSKRAATVLLTSLAEAIEHLHDDQPPSNL